MTHWLSYGGGVNSTALAILLCDGKLPQYVPWRIVFADTYDEQEATYQFIDQTFRPYLRRYGVVLETVCDRQGVLARAEKYSFTISRQYRSCTENGKVLPVRRHLKAHGDPDDVQIIGIDAGEAHRAKGGGEKSFPRIYPLIELGYDRDDCERIIRDAGLPIPKKSGCWHCPFMSVGEVMQLVQAEPCRAERIHQLEIAAIEAHGPFASTVGEKIGCRMARACKPRRERRRVIRVGIVRRFAVRLHGWLSISAWMSGSGDFRSAENDRRSQIEAGD